MLLSVLVSHERVLTFATEKTGWVESEMFMARLMMLFMFALGLTASAGAQETPSPKRLNNMVVELLKTDSRIVEAGEDYPFSNPRDGWVYISAGAGESGRMPAEIITQDGERLPMSGQAETMLLLPKGLYRLRAAGPIAGPIIVRAMPETHFVRYPQEPRFPELGSFTWEWLKENVLSSVNTVVGYPQKGIDAEIDDWTGAGRKFIAYGGLPEHEGLTGEQAFEHWFNNPGFQDPRLSGLIADEFSGRQHPLYPAWIEGMRMLGERVAGTGKAFYGYCGGPGMHSRPEAQELVRTVFDAGFYMAWERYHHEMPSLEEARALMDRLLGEEIRLWRARFPECQRRMVLVLGIFATGPELDVQPDVNYKVWMDMQMQYLATHPDFDGLFGVHWWYSGGASEEILRWESALYRHYCIEGATDLLSRRYSWTYLLDHIVNPDFLDGLDGWEVEPAGDGSMAPRYLERYARAQNRYWQRGVEPDYPSGNAYLWMQRRADRPNKASQEVRNLQPGKVYTAQMITADYLDIVGGKSEEKKHGVALTIEGAEIIPGGCYRSVPVSSPWTHAQLPFENGPAWFNHHRVMFRAMAPTARITLSDWASDLDPGGPEGQELMFNYIQVQPYYEK